MTPKLAFPLILPTLLSVTVNFFFSQTSGALENSTTSVHRVGPLQTIPLSGTAVGPESFAFDPLGGGPYTGVSDGRIVKWLERERRWTDFATISPTIDGCQGPHDHQSTEHICGRPLGLKFNESSGDLYIADSYMGLLKVGPQGGLATRIVTRQGGTAFGFTNGLDIDLSNDVVYFTDSSSRYSRRNHLSLVLSGDKSGRLMRYDPKSQEVSLLLGNLSFPNGVALSEDKSFILLVETTKCRVMRYWLQTPKAGTLEVLALLPGFPDNIKRSPRGGYWVGMHSRREKLLEMLLSRPWIGKALVKLPFDVVKAHAALAKFRGSGLAVRLSEEGEVLESFEEIDGEGLSSVSEVMEEDGKLWIGSVSSPFAGRYDYM
ncbi:hypothetical protein K2173_010945 [Erythroxylum novogranatense]|uniref:Strictosidine synthase conserved region domain-containing protein n=1 Tax=Erythroxylum novogranatense TaxID=1862640 RepID=A0AAV8T1D0_9ROSI|nr:hypothetical protein K2173_010945 [Erythroxylum novogranatense]